MASSRGHSTRLAAPSEMGAQSNMPRGDATGPDFRTVSRVMAFLNWALGFRAPWKWLLTEKEAISSLVATPSWIMRCAIMACRPAKVTPMPASHSASAVASRTLLMDTSSMSVIFSAPPTRTTSCIPDATAMTACLKATPPDAPPASTLVAGMLLVAIPE